MTYKQPDPLFDMLDCLSDTASLVQLSSTWTTCRACPRPVHVSDVGRPTGNLGLVDQAGLKITREEA